MKPPVSRSIAFLAIVLLIAAVTALWWVLKERKLKAREDELRQVLYSIRNSIDQFSSDTDRCPEALADLISSGYLRAIPIDPITRSETTWQPVYDNSIIRFSNPGKTAPACLVDIHSGSKDAGSDGTRYDQW